MRIMRRRQHYWLALAVALALTGAAACQPELPRPPAEPPERSPAAAPADDLGRPVVVFLGDSLSAGYGLRAEQAFPALIQDRIDAEGLGFRVVNAGVSGDTSAGGLRRIDWLLRQPIDTLVLELGGNDMLRGQDVDRMRQNLQAIVEKARAKNPDAAIVIAGMRATPNLGRDYSEAYEASFAELARDTDATLIPFMLKGVAADRSLNQVDGIHPTAEGHEIVADTLWAVLGPLLRERTAR